MNYLEIKIINKLKYWQFELPCFDIDGMNVYDKEKKFINKLIKNTNSKIFIERCGFSNNFIEKENIIEIATNLPKKSMRTYWVKGFEVKNELFDCLFGTIYLLDNRFEWIDFLTTKIKEKFLFKNNLIIMSISFNDMGDMTFKVSKNDDTLIEKIKKELEYIGYSLK